MQIKWKVLTAALNLDQLSVAAWFFMRFYSVAHYNQSHQECVELMNAMANQRRSDELCCSVHVPPDWIQLSCEFSHHKQQSADVRMM